MVWRCLPTCICRPPVVDRKNVHGFQDKGGQLRPMTLGVARAHNLQQWTFLTFFAVFELGSLICGVATSSKMLIGGRVVAGLGSSGLFSGILVMIADCAPLERRPGASRKRIVHH
jgi:MFS family permease